LRYEERFAQVSVNKLIYKQQQKEAYKQAQQIGKIKFNEKIDSISLIEMKMRRVSGSVFEKQ
jgi:hypothetical protein